MRCKTHSMRSEMRVYATIFLMVCCFLYLPCAGEESKANNVSSSSIGRTIDYIDRCRFNFIKSVPRNVCIFSKIVKIQHNCIEFLFFSVSSIYFSYLFKYMNCLNMM